MDFGGILRRKITDLESRQKMLLTEGKRVFHDNGLEDLFKFIVSTAAVDAMNGTDARKIADVMTKIALTTFYKNTGGNLGTCRSFVLNEGLRNDFYYLVITACCGYTTIRDRCCDNETQNVIVARLDFDGEIFIYRTDNVTKRFYLTRDCLTEDVSERIIMFILTGEV